MFATNDVLETFDSILLYYFVFFIAFCVFILADRSKSDKRTAMFTFLGVLLLSLFAGIRDLSVGIDTELTVFLFFDLFKNASSLDVALEHTFKEPIYGGLSYFLHKISDEPWVFLFTTQFLTAGPVAIALYRYRKKVLISIGMLVYMLMFYQFSLNIVRQSIAAAFLFWAFVEYLNGCYSLSVGLSALCLLFHRSGVIGVVGLLFVIFLARIKNNRTRLLIVFASVLASCLLLLYWRTLFTWVISIGLLSSSYMRYIAIFSGESGIGGAHTFIHGGIGGTAILRILVLSFSVMFSVYVMDVIIKKYDYKDLSMKYGVIFSLALYTAIFIVLHTSMGWRFTVYFEYFYIILCSRIYTLVSDRTVLFEHGKVHVNNFASLGFIFCPFIYNFVMLMIKYSFGTLPYITILRQ